jgi:hypothetical protein
MSALISNVIFVGCLGGFLFGVVKSAAILLAG